MSIELKLLQAIAQDRSLLPIVEAHLPKNVLSTLGGNILKELTTYYTNDSAVLCVDKDIFVSHMGSKLKNLPNRDVVYTLIDKLFDPVSIPNVLGLLKDLQIEAISEEVLRCVSQKKWKTLPKLLTKLEAVTTSTNTTNEVEVSLVNNLILDTLFNSDNTKRIFKLAPKKLNEEIGGGARRGNHIGIVAVPETGKSLIAINMLASLCNQGHKVLYIGNEDPLSSIAVRFACRFLKQPEGIIRSNMEAVQEQLNNTGYKNLFMASLPFSSTSAITKLVEECHPDVLCVDQIRNIVCTDSGGLTSTLEAASKYMRNVAKKYNLLAISVTQAGDCATGKLVLDRSDVDSSKIGFAAQLDLMLGVGVNQEWYDAEKRMLSLKGKNKLSGKHTFFPVRINRQTNEVTEI